MINLVFHYSRWALGGVMNATKATKAMNAIISKDVAAVAAEDAVATMATASTITPLPLPHQQLGHRLRLSALLELNLHAMWNLSYPFRFKAPSNTVSQTNKSILAYFYSFGIFLNG